MKPRRTHRSTRTLGLPNGNEDNDLWVTDYLPSRDDPDHAIGATFVPTDEERARIAAGENVELIIWAPTTYPVALRVVDYPIGKKPAEVPS